MVTAEKTNLKEDRLERLLEWWRYYSENASPYASIILAVLGYFIFSVISIRGMINDKRNSERRYTL